MRKILPIMLLLFIFATGAGAQELRIQYPSDGDTVRYSKIYLAGWISDTTAKVTVNGETKRVYGSGAFVGLLPLGPGWNNFTITAVTTGSTLTDTLRLYRQPPPEVLPEQPVAFAGDNLLPAADITYYAPDMLIVQFRGSPGGKAYFSIDDLTDDPLPMEELSPDASGGLAGVYRGSYMIREKDACEHEPIVFTLVGKNGDDEDWETDRFITVHMTGQPVIAETRSGNNIIFKAPWSEIMMELPDSIRIPVISEWGGWAKLAISTDLTGLISRRDIEILPAGSVCSPLTVNGFSSAMTGDWLTFSFHLAERVPFDLHQDTNNGITLDLYHTYMDDEWTTLAADDNPGQPDSMLFESFTWEQITDNDLRFRFHFRTPQLWGFRGWYEGSTFKLAVRKPPVIDPSAPFKNLIIALDAGHGGQHRGAVGATGYMEKDANLAYVLDLAKMLEEAGAQVVLTRDTDTTMWLKARADTARKYNAQILVWMHNNGIGSSTDPESIMGTSTYYTHLQGMPFALYVYPELLRLGLKPFGRVHRSYYITRQSDMIIFLVEGAFMTNPEDEMFLMDKNDLNRLARAVFNGMERYLKILAAKQ
jgi:N-acetylmuramoyl-L-alanine amidase